MAGVLARRFSSQLVQSNKRLGLRNLRVSYRNKSDAAHSFWDEAGSIDVVQHPNDGTSHFNSVSASTDSKYPKIREHFPVQTENAEVWRPTAYGFIRLDSDNPPREFPSETIEEDNKNSFIDQYFFGDALNEKANKVVVEESVKVKSADLPSDTNEIDRQYFYKNEEGEDKGTSTVSANELEFEDNEVDEQYFGKTFKKGEMSAYDYIQSYRRQLNEDLKAGKLQSNSAKKSEGEEIEQRSYKKMVPDITYLPNDVIVSILKQSILHNKNGIVAINKPYGLVTVDQDHNSKLVLTELLPLLASKLKVEKLYTVHRLDRDTTGVLLLASTQEMAKKLSDMFQQHQIKKKYLTITKKIPNLNEGIIDIPITEATLQNRKRMKLRPVRPHSDPGSAQYNARGKSSRAVTHFKVVRTSGSAALVELEPETGVRHQLRVHLSQGLNCTILGDHKYSHEDKYAPQKLPDDMLVKLGLPQAKVRQVPMHLHAISLVLPGLGDEGKDLSLSAPLPPFFRYTLKKLKLGSKKK